MRLDGQGFFETRGFEVLVFCNWYDGLFSDAKMAGIELIHHGVRTATNGDVRLGSAPGQWDPVPRCVERKVDPEKGRVEVLLEYPHHDFSYRLAAEAVGEGVEIRVVLDRPLPPSLEGRAGFNFEFLPSAYFGSSWYADGRSGLFPRYPSSLMEPAGGSSGISLTGAPTGSVFSSTGAPDPLPIATGEVFVLAPENPERRVTVRSTGAGIGLYDGRNTAQNGWFVLRSRLPSRKTGIVLTWSVSGSAIPGWTREPVVAHSQVGYHPGQEKIALLELDRNDAGGGTVRLIGVDGSANDRVVFEGEAGARKPFLRYDYAGFDFTSVREEGVYVLEYRGKRTAPFRIARDVYADAWHPSLDVFFPVQMDHMEVREAYRVWHGACHLDDARQAPAGHVHFDLYAMGPSTDTPFRAGEHIPGLDVGGWFDAGDFDIRTQTQYAVLLELVHAWERWKPLRDTTTVDQERRCVEIHRPDGVPDLIQQIEHGALALLAQYRAVGHALAGIVEPDLRQYTHLGDAASKTDNRVFDPSLAPGVTGDLTGGTPDDRWAFTSKSTPLDYGAAAALAASYRALRGYSEMADECLLTAKRVWAEEHSRAPALWSYGNTTGGRLEDEEFGAAVELLITTGDASYAERIRGLEPLLDSRFAENARAAVRAMPYMDGGYRSRLETRVRAYAGRLADIEAENPFGVPITRGGWAGNGTILRFALTNFELHEAFPELIGAESVYRGLTYLLGRHPGSDISFVSGVGARSKEVAYGNNRADFTFIAGGVVPGVLVLKPDFPENKEDWPFLWGENEYVVNEAAGFIFLSLAADGLANAAHGAAAKRPIVTDLYTADPSAHVFDGTLYVYPSHDIDTGVPDSNEGAQFDMRDYHVYSFRSMKAAAVDHGVALKLEDVPWASNRLWAPDAAKKGDSYYLYFPARDSEGIFRIGAAVSPRPEGPFTADPEPIPGSFSIDPAVFVDDDGQAYMYFGGLWGGQLERWRTGTYDPKGKEPGDSEPALGPRVAKLSPGMRSFDGPVREVSVVNDGGKPIRADETDKRFFEACWMHKYGGNYYLSYSTGDTHLLVYAVGKSPTGPFTYKGILLNRVEGWTTHHSIVEFQGKWYLFYHDSTLSGGKTHLRCVKFQEFSYNPDGTIPTMNP